MATNAAEQRDAHHHLRVARADPELWGKSFAVRLWDGTLWGNTEQPRFTLVLNHPGALRAMFLSPSELTLGEAFIYRYRR